jgi:alkylation response protein AidB-like acyl-CoA dehydrogenase
MNNYQTPLRDQEFALFELLDYDTHCKSLNILTLDKELAKAFLAEAARFADQTVAPLGAVSDREGCRLENGDVITPPGFKEAYQLYCDAGWPQLARSNQFGGQGVPQSLGLVISEIMGTPCWAWGMYPGLSQGAMHTLEVHGTAQQKQLYLPKLVNGLWSGTMCLTESHSGSDLGLLRTRAEPLADGSYAITGTKVFISSGDHDLAENIIHIVLARLPDAPGGTRGISMFVVPKWQVDTEGNLGARNAVICTGLEEKMGIHGNATCELQFEGAQGWLLGEANKGLNHMFTFMNLARIGTALHGQAHAELGYQMARAYAHERLQMRSLTGAKNPSGVADPIIVHPDVRRMLLTQKAIVEGLRMLNYTAALKVDETMLSSDPLVAQKAGDLLGLLTPIAKAFSTELGFESANLALQCFGGHGYIRDWGVEQNLRDCRIATLYEGTTGIQALDLLARKVLGSRGESLELLLEEINSFVQANSDESRLTTYGAQLLRLQEEWRELSRLIAYRSESNPDEIGAAAVDYLMYSGYLLMAYLWAKAVAVALQQLDQSTPEAGFYQAKLATAEFYFARILPRTHMHAAAIRSGANNLMALASEDF